MLSSAHHSAREMIVTHGKFRLSAKVTFEITIQNKIKEKNQILLKIFIKLQLTYKSYNSFL